MSNVFSIVIPVFNPSEQLLRCLKSIQGQTFDRYEIIIVDYRNSISCFMLNQIQSTQGIIYESISRRGVYAAMNTGLELAKGTWVLFMGHDDYLFSQHTLSLVHRHIESSKRLPMAFYGNCFINGNTGWAASESIYAGRFSLATLFERNICQQAIFYHRISSMAAGKMNDTDGVTGDWKFNLKLSLLGQLSYMPYIVSVFSAGGLSSNIKNTNDAFSPTLSCKFIYMLYRECGFSVARSMFYSVKTIVNVFIDVRASTMLT